MQKVLQAWIEGSRPKTWIASISPVVIGTLLAPHPNFVLFVATLLCALFIQIGTNLANDYYDCVQGKDTSLRKGPRRIGQSGIIPLSTLFYLMVLSFGMGLLFCIPLINRGGMGILGMFGIAVLLGIFYTKGPISYGYKGVTEPIVLFAFGSFATLFTTYLQTLQFSWTPFLVGFAPGCFSVALLAVNNLRDFAEDSITQKRTMVVRYGESFGRLEVCSAILIPFVIVPNLLNVFLIPLVYTTIQHLFSERAPALLLPRVAFTFILFTLFYVVTTFAYPLWT